MAGDGGGGARTPQTPKAPTLQARGGLLRGDVLHHLGAPKDDVEPGVSLEVQHPVRVKVFDGLLRRKERMVRVLPPQPPSRPSHSDPRRASGLRQHI